MNQDQMKSGVAQPAEEELKKHGDQLEKQVKEAAGQPDGDEKSDRDKAGASER